MALFGSSTPNNNPQDVKNAIKLQLQQEAAMSNARSLIGKINEHCYDACIPSPGSSMSPKEETCLSQCMEKYIATWNAVSKAYIGRVAQESKRLGGQENTIAMNSLAVAPNDQN